MKIHLIVIFVAAIVFSGCKQSTDPEYEKFKADVISQCKSDYKTLFNDELNDQKIVVINSNELKGWIEKSQWKDKDLPCEIKEIMGRDRGDTDPSPIALDISSSQDHGVIYVPVVSKVSCSSPKKSFFLEDDDCVQVMFCHGEIGGDCYCICRFPCNSEENLCGICPDE